MRSMTLMPVSRISALGLWSSRAGASRCMGERCGDDGGAAVDGPARQVEHAAEHFLADGHGDGRAGAARDQAARKALGGLHGDAAGHAVARVQEALGQDLGPVLALDLDRVEYGRQVPPSNLQVEDGSRHAHDRSNAFAHLLIPFRLAPSLPGPRRPATIFRQPRS